MSAILCENFGGKWPFWLSPQQAKIITIHKSMNDYADKVKKQLFDAGFEVDFDPENPDTLNKQVRAAELSHYNFILVIGPQEVDNGSVNVRCGGKISHGKIKIEELIKKFKRFSEEYTREAEKPEEYQKWRLKAMKDIKKF